MAFLTLLLILIVFIFMEINAEKRILPFKTIFNTLHREPPIAINVKNKNSQKNIQELWIEQPLNHFDNNELFARHTWHMRYMRNDQHYKPGGAIFIFVGGEWEINAPFLLAGHMFDMAQEYNGIMYYTEHRYYGKSWPTINTTVNNLQYLHSKQAIADLAQFIQKQKTENAGLQNATVILTGGSYAGSMVIWLTKLYPNVVTAGWASSAPIRAKLDFYEYLEHVGDAIKTVGGTKCYQRVQNGIKALQNSFTTNYAYVILEQLKMCNNFDVRSKLNLAAFFNAIGNYFGALVQSYSDSIKPTCNYLLSLHSDDDLLAFTHYLTDIFWPTSHYYTEFCIDLTYEATKQMFTDVNDLYSGSRQWFYQTCNEFGWFTTSLRPNLTDPKPNNLFGHYVNLHFFQQLCADVFGNTHTLAAMAKRIEMTNNFYESQQELDAVIMTHGQLDPWSAVGETHGSNVLLIPGYSHVADFNSININDSVAMNVAKLKVSSFIRQRIWKARNGDITLQQNSN